MPAQLDGERFRPKLLDLEQELTTRLGREIDTVREVHDDTQDTGDVAVADELKDESFALAQSDSEILVQVRAALRRIDDGTFGHCVVGGERIEDKRLEAVPWTPFCLKHQEELEIRQPRRTPTL